MKTSTEIKLPMSMPSTLLKLRKNWNNKPLNKRTKMKKTKEKFLTTSSRDN